MRCSDSKHSCGGGEVDLKCEVLFSFQWRRLSETLSMDLNPYAKRKLIFYVSQQLGQFVVW